MFWSVIIDHVFYEMYLSIYCIYIVAVSGSRGLYKRNIKPRKSKCHLCLVMSAQHDVSTDNRLHVYTHTTDSGRFIFDCEHLPHLALFKLSGLGTRVSRGVGGDGTLKKGFQMQKMSRVIHRYTPTIGPHVRGTRP